MEIEETDIKDVSNCEESHSAVNNLILDYYKRFGKKRDLEQFFSLSTAQSEIRDPSSLFWRRMKSQDESSDSGGKKSESSTELCRISIKCSIPEARPSSQGNQSRVKSDSESPPIISEDVITEPTRNSDDESVKSDDLQSQKSVDGTLDTSANKPHSPTSSINSQRKLEWDSLADVGYANESDRKNSASSLSTLERMALQQQYSNETKNTDFGQPTAQSTPFDVNENKSKFKKSVIKKTTKIYNKDINSLELSVPPMYDTNPQSINLNLTKHISFNVDRNGSVVVENMAKNVSLSPEKVSVETEVTPQIKIDKEIQTTLNRDKTKFDSANAKITSPQVKRYPVLINLNTLKKKTRKKKVKRTQKSQSKGKIISDKENLPLEKFGDQLSEAESFEYMPGHIYNENRMKNNQQKNNVSGNKSSLESSGITTDSSNKKYSFTKDLERSINILKSTFNDKYEDVSLRKQLVKEIVQKIVDSKYSGEKSSTEFLSGLSFDSKKLGLRDPSYSTSTTNTSDVNTSAKKASISKPKKSILRVDKFTTSALASTSQSVPNIPIFTNNEAYNSSKILKSKGAYNTDSDYSTKTKNLSDTAINRASSEELYKKYLEALKREEAHKKHLKDKELFFKQKLGNSGGNFNVVRQMDSETQNRIKHLMKDLVRNNYDDGSGDASKLEASSANLNIEKYNSIRKQQSHSVFTLSSGNSENYYKTETASNKHQNGAGCSRLNKTIKHYCCCPYHSLQPKVGVTDSSVQVSIECPKNLNTTDHKINSSLHQHQNISEMQPLKSENPTRKEEIISECIADNIKYVCLCTEEGVVTEEIPENFLIYKCSRLPTKCIKLGGIVSKVTNTPSVCSSKSSFKSQDCEKKCLVIKDSNSSNNLTSKSSQTNLILPIILKGPNSQDLPSSLSEIKVDNETNIFQMQSIKANTYVHEATRCIQTEISIDPKKSDPSLSDINIVDNSNCVKLIHEQYKKVSQPILEANENTEYNINELEQRSNSLSDNKKTESECTCAVDEDRFISTNNSGKKIDKGVQFNHITNNVTDKVDQSPNNFSIPIQGTNMTLKVTLGSGVNDVLNGDDNIARNLKNSATLASKGTETEKYPGVENFTSLQEECSKEAQCSDTNILEMLHQKPSSECTIRSTAIDTCDSDTNKNETTTFPSKSQNVNTYMTTTDFKFNTYPTETQSHTQKPLLRSNTDPSKIEKASHVKLNQKTFKELQNLTDDMSIHQNKYIEDPKNEMAASCPKISAKSLDITGKSNVVSDTDKQSQFKTSSSESDSELKSRSSQDPLLDIIQDITKRFSKKHIEKSKRKKCFKEIITVLNYLLDTEESTDPDHNNRIGSFSRNNICEVGNLPEKESTDYIPTKTLVDKGIQLSMKKCKTHKTESSDLPISTDIPSTSSDSATCKVLNKIKRECEKYHQKRCKLHTGGKKCEVSSSSQFTEVNCDQCRRVHHCTCRGHRCKNHRMKTVERTKKKSVAYNLIVQTSDSIVSEEIKCGKNRIPLQNIIVKVPSKRTIEKLPFKEISEKIERDMPTSSNRDNRVHRSKSLPKESGISSTDEFVRKAQAYTVREYLEKNRPDFVEKCSDRQQCLKVINESRASERAAKRQLLSLQLDRQQTLNALSESDLKDFARELGKELRRKKVAPKFINEREMKKHSEKIYKSLPEVVNKKEELKKENLKKTNLLMANIFKKNLQKKTLHGTVNISNYSTVIKI